MSQRYTAEQVERARRRLSPGVTPEARAWFERVMVLRSTTNEREAFEVYCCNDADGVAVAVRAVCAGCGWERGVDGETFDMVAHGLDSLGFRAQYVKDGDRQGVE